MRLLALGLTVCLATEFASAAAPTVVAYEGFNYSAGNLIGQNGGTGWSSAWTKYYGAGGDMLVNATGFTYSGLSTVGGKTEWGSGGNAISQAERALPLQNSGIVYIQFMSQLESGSSGGGTPELRLRAGGTGTGGFGGNGGTYAAKMSILDAALNPKSDGTSSTSANLNSLNLVVIRINYSTSLTEMWVNPNLSTFDYSNPPAANAQYASFAPAFDSIGLYTRSPGNFDEITVMTMSNNTAPTDVALSATSINENNAANATVGTLSSTDADSGDTFTYSLVSGTGSTDNASFNISGSSLRLTGSANYETKSSYSVRIRTTDSGSGTFEKAFTITVNNLAEAPTNISLSATSVAENVAGGTTVGTLSTTDDDAGDTFSYALVSGTGSTDNASFTITGTSLSINSSPDYEAKSSYAIRVRTTDSTSNTFEKQFTVTISNVNEGPSISAISDQTVNEDTPTSALAFTISDPETAAGSLTLTGASTNTTLVPVSNITFGGSGGSRTVTVTPAANKFGTATITVTVSDGSLSANAPFLLTVTSVPDAPSFNPGSSQLLYETVTPIRVSNNITYSVNNAAALSSTPFTRVRYRMQTQVSGVIRYADVSFDAWSGLTVTNLQVPTPNTPFVIQRNVTNMTVDSNYTGVVNATAQTGRLEIWPYNYSQGASGGVGGSSTTYDFDDTSAGSAAYGSFQVHNLSSTPKQTVLAWNNHSASPPDVGFGNRPTADPDWTFAGASGLGVTNWKLQIYIGDSGLPSTFTVTEDTASDLLMGGTPFADGDDDPLTVTLEIPDGVITGNAGTGVTVGGTATARTFSGTVADLNAYFTTSGKVTYLGVTNNTSSRTLTITSNDGTTSSVTTSTVNFTPVNDNPTDVALGSSTLAENVAANSTVGTLSTTDVDSGDTFTYTLVSGTGSTDNASFNISGNALRITNSPNYEVKNSYAVRVRSTDAGGLWVENNFTINITDVNETPTDITLSSASIAENSAAGSTVGAFSTTDQDTGNTFTYTLVSGTGSTDNASFTISGNSLTINASPNYEAKSSYAIRVRTTDSTSLFFEKQFTITITNVNETPTISAVSDQTINEDAATSALAITIGDPETAASSLTLSAASTNTTLVPVSNVVFGGSGANRTVTVSPAANEFGSATITVTVSDGSLSADAVFAVTVNSVNDVPSFTLPAGQGGATWTAHASTGIWYSIASSSDGTKLVAGAYGGLLYTSTDSGATWTSRNGPTTRNYYGVASSADGTKLAAVVTSGQIYTSTDSGATWTARSTNRIWRSIASSADGTKLVATVEGGFIVTSSDSGVNWTNRDSSRAWWGVASSADGTKLVATVNGGQIYTSTDSGATWTAHESARYWRGCASSSDGTKLVAMELNGNIYTSTDSGSTWTARQSAQQWTNVASSADGTRLVAAAKNNYVYTSSDSGVTWTARDSARGWWSVSSSADGSKLAAGIENGLIYTSSGSGGTTVTVAEDAGAQTTAGFATSISTGPANESAQTFAFHASNNNSALFSSAPAIATDGTLTFTTAANANGSATVSVYATDDGGTANGGVDTSGTQTFTISVTAVNDTPAGLTLSANTIAENNSANATVGTLSATDSDAGDTQTYTLVAGTGDDDNASFTISGTSLKLTPSADYETKNSYSVRVRVTDSTGLYAEAAFTINISDVNETPSDIALSSTIITESTTTNDTVGTLSTTDQDSGDTFTYTLVSGTGSTDNAAFNILGSTLRITAAPNYATQNAFSVRIRATDAGGLYTEKSFGLSVIAPEIVLSQAASGLNSGDTFNFGSVVANTTVYRTFTIQNTGAANLTGVGLTLDGVNASNFAITATPASTVSGGSSTTFTLSFTPNTLTTRTAAIHIASNDADEGTFNITLTGKGGHPAAALAMDGVDDTIEIDADASFNSSTFTVEGWVKPSSSTPDWSRLWGTENNKGDLIIKTASENRFSFAPYIDGSFRYVYAPSTWTPGRWYHVAGVVDETKIRLFVDGVEVASRDNPGTWTGDSGKRYIGRCTAPNPPNRLKGTIDEVRYWNYARNCDQIQQTYDAELTGAEAGLVAYYNFNQGVADLDNSGVTTVTDVTGHGHDAAMTNFSLADGNNSSNWTTPGGVTVGDMAPTPQFAEINVKGNGQTVHDDDTKPTDQDDTDFGDPSVEVTRTFTIQNLGNIDLDISDIHFEGDSADDFTLGGITLPAVIAGGGSTTFTVTIEPTTTGARRATVVIENADCDEGTYDFAIQSLPAIAITTAAGVMTVSDPTSADGTTEISEPSAGTIRFSNESRAFTLNGGARQFGDSGGLSLAGIDSISMTGGGGNDEINVGAFAGALPSLTIVGGGGHDTVHFNGSLSFVDDASLDVEAADLGTGEVSVAAGVVISAAGTGEISLVAGKWATFDAGAQIRSEDGNIAIEANQTAAATGDFSGVTLSGATIESTGAGAITIKGRGGDGTNWQRGILLANGAKVLSGSGNVTLIGTGGPATGVNGYGVHLTGASAVSSDSGDAAITGIEGTSSFGVGLVLQGTSSVATSGAASTIRLTANSLLVDGTSTVTASATGTVAVAPYTAGVGINLGTTANTIGGPVGLTDAELDQMMAGTLAIGDAATGDIAVSAPISRTAATQINLTNSSDINLGAISLASGGGNVSLHPGRAVTATGLGTDVEAGTVSIGGSRSLSFAINGISPGRGYEQLTVSGAIDLAGTALGLTGSYVPTKGQSFTLVDNDGSDAVLGAFDSLPEGSTVNLNGVPMILSYHGGTGNDVTLSYAAPTLTVAKASLTGNEGCVFANQGTLLDLQGNVTLSASFGTATNNGDGTWSWSGTPADGPDATGTVTVTATDDSSPPLTATVSFHLTVKNTAPVAQAQALSVNEDAAATPITLAATDAGSDTLTYSIVSAPPAARGTLSAVSGNVVQFTPTPDFVGTATFTFKATDSDGAASSPAAVTITVNAVNDAPSFVKGVDRIHIAGTKTAQTVAGWARSITDGDADQVQTLTFNVTEVGSSGIFTTAPAISNKGTLTYKPNGVTGSATLSVTLTDSGGATSAAQTFKIAVASFGPGTYTGLARPSGATVPSQYNLGLVSGTLTSTGSFSGKVNFGGTTTPFSTVFSLATGHATGSKSGLISWDLDLDVMGGTDKITGTVRRIASGSVTDVCDVDTDRATFSAANPVPSRFRNTSSSGTYTLAFPSKAQTPEMDSHLYPQGDGFGKITMTANGVLTLAGTLADGTAITASAPLSKAYAWPLAAIIKSTTSVAGMTFGGMVQFDTTPADSDLSATDLQWFRPAFASTKGYAAGWPGGIAVDAVGALYSTSTNVEGSLGLAASEGGSANAELMMTDGKLTAPVVKNEIKVAGNVVTKTPATNSTFTISVVPSTGLFSGTFTPNWTSPATAKPGFKGVMIQKGANKGGYGFFLSNAKSDTAPESGGVTFGSPQ